VPVGNPPVRSSPLQSLDAAYCVDSAVPSSVRKDRRRGQPLDDLATAPWHLGPSPRRQASGVKWVVTK
jgi:hypothetical protein